MNGSISPRVLHVAEANVGGVSSYLQEIISFQTETLGADNLRVLVPRDQATGLGDIDPATLLCYERTGRNLRSLLSLSLALVRALRTFRPTVVHLHSTFAGAIARPMILLQRPRPRVVYCAHGWSFLMDIAPWKQQVYLGVERALARITDVVVNISRYEDQQAKARGICAAKCVVVRNAVSPASPSGIAQIPFDPAKINLLFVGRFDRQKGLDLLARAMTRVPDLPLHLYVIGSGFHDNHTPEPAPNVTLLGWRPRAMLDDYYAAADAVVMPSRWEGFGLVAVEAMRNRTAVLASNRGALPELISEGETGRLFELDEDHLDDLVRVLRGLDKDELRRMGEAAHQHYQRYFTADLLNRSLLEIYAALHERQPARELHLRLSRSNPA